MITAQNTTTIKEIQENYSLIANQVKKTGKPLVILRNNKPDVAIISVKKLEELEAIGLLLQSRKEAGKGKAKVLKGTLSELWYETQNS